jgi:hypothetical protein
MRKKTRHCIVCGKEYSYCNNCIEYASSPAWMAIYHDENCKEIMNVATEYMAGNLTKAEAKDKFDACDLSNKKHFKESVIKVINDVCSVKKIAKSEKETAVEIKED